MFMVGRYNRYANDGQQVLVSQIMAFTCGIIIIAICLLSPLHFISDNYLFSGHMLQHVLLTLLAPPLIIYGILYDKRQSISFILPFKFFTLANLELLLWALSPGHRKLPYMVCLNMGMPKGPKQTPIALHIYQIP